MPTPLEVNPENPINPADKCNNVTRLAFGIVQWLASRQLPSGAIRGEDDLPSSPVHYAHSFSALAMALVAAAGQLPEMWVSAENAVQYTIGLPARSRSVQEFNSLALLMLTKRLRRSSGAPIKLRDTLDTLITGPGFLYDGGRQVSNNWLAMRAVCFLILGHLTSDDRSLRRGEELIRQTLAWQLSDGVFVDYPKKPRYAFATPLTYHAKMCAMLSMAVEYTEQPELLPSLERGLRALTGLMSSSGECLFYGRSCNSLFGLAATYFALRVAMARSLEGDWEYATACVTARLEALSQKDGHLRLTPALDESGRYGWDVYYHLEVYNAYAAALLLSAPNTLPKSIAQNRERRTVIRLEPFILPDAGLITIRGPRFFVALSTRGQCVLDGTSLFCDARYIGMQPLLVECDGKPQIPEPPLRWKGARTKADAVSPRNVGFLPFIALNGLDYCVRVYDEVSISSGEGWHAVCGRGKPVALSLPGRPLRIARRARGKLTGGGDLAFTPKTLGKILLSRAVIIFPLAQALLIIDGFEGDWPGDALWHGPNARFMPDSTLTLHSVLDNRELREVDTVPTSRGEARYYACSTPEVSSPDQGCVTAIVCAPSGINARVEVRAHHVTIVVNETQLCLNLQTKTIQKTT